MEIKNPQRSVFFAQTNKLQFFLKMKDIKEEWMIMLFGRFYMLEHLFAIWATKTNNSEV